MGAKVSHATLPDTIYRIDTALQPILEATLHEWLQPHLPRADRPVFIH